MELTREKVGEVTVLTAQGDSLDASNVGEFKRDLVGATEPGAKVLLDLGEVQFVDSAGCGAILSLLKQLRAVQGELKLCAVTRPVRALFELVRFHNILDIVDTREAALKAFGA